MTCHYCNAPLWTAEQPCAPLGYTNHMAHCADPECVNHTKTFVYETHYDDGTIETYTLHYGDDGFVQQVVEVAS